MRTWEPRDDLQGTRMAAGSRNWNTGREIVKVALSRPLFRYVCVYNNNNVSYAEAFSHMAFTKSIHVANGCFGNIQSDCFTRTGRDCPWTDISIRPPVKILLRVSTRKPTRHNDRHIIRVQVYTEICKIKRTS